jgi:hypothetical protein
MREILVATEKERSIEELLEQEKNIVIPNMTVLWGYEEISENCWRCSNLRLSP